MLNCIDTYNKLPCRTALTSTGTQAKYMPDEWRDNSYVQNELLLVVVVLLLVVVIVLVVVVVVEVVVVVVVVA